MGAMAESETDGMFAAQKMSFRDSVWGVGYHYQPCRQSNAVLLLLSYRSPDDKFNHNGVATYLLRKPEHSFINIFLRVARFSEFPPTVGVPRAEKKPIELVVGRPPGGV